MITAVLDTNVIVQAVISQSGAASSQTVDACFDGRYRPIFSNATLDELLQVLGLPYIRARHGLTDDEVLQLVSSLLANAIRCLQVPKVASPVRDITDTKFLSLAEAAGSEFLVTNDRRHLLRLKSFGRTRIVTPAQFLRELDRSNA